MSKARKFTLCTPDKMADALDKAYDKLTNIDCNFSRLIQSILGSIIGIATLISKQGLNYRHYNWELIIRNKKTKICYCKTGKIIIKEAKDESIRD